MNRKSNRSVGMVRDAGQTRPSLMECLDTFMAQADTLIDGVVEGLAQSVKGAVGLAGVGFDAKALSPLVNNVVMSRSAVKERFKSSLHKGMYEGPGIDPNQRRAVTFEELKFFEEDQLDSSIELARLGEDIERCVSTVLPSTHALMSAMLGWVSVQPQLNPVRPEVFARALRDALAEPLGPPAAWGGGSTGREQVMAAAAGYLGMALAKVYKQNMDWLKSTGLEPAGLNLSEAPVSAAAAKAGNQPESSLAKTLLTLDRLRKLLTGQIDLDAPHMASLVGAMGGRDFLHTVPASMIALEDMKQVDALVERLAEKAKAGPASPEAAAKQRALAVELRLGKQLGKHLGTEVIRLMVENLTQDERLLPPVRQLLQLLEPQLIALGNKDQRFFAEREHVARVLIDRIANRSLGFSTTSDFGFADFYQSIKLVLGSLSQPSDDVLSAFTAALKLLDLTWQKQDEADRQHQDDAAKALAHIEQRNLLAQHISSEFRTKLHALDISPIVVVFLCGPWAQVLAERQIQSLQPQARFDELADNLLWSVQTHRARKNPSRLVQLVPEMVRTMREGLHSVDYPREMVVEFFDELIRLHEAALEGVSRVGARGAEAIDPVATKAEPAIVAEMTDSSDPGDSGDSKGPDTLPESGDADFFIAQREGIESGFLDRNDPGLLDIDDGNDAGPVLEPLPIGTWVDMQIEGALVRVNLRWMSPYKNLFMFVTRDGRTHSLARKSLDRMRSNGSVKVVAQGGVVDAALDRVANTALKNSLKSPES